MLKTARSTSGTQEEQRVTHRIGADRPALCRSRVVEDIRQRKGTPWAEHLKFVLSVIEGRAFH
jgi:hypothetical protein